MVGKNDLRAELLTDVLCVEDDGNETLTAAWDTQLNLTAIHSWNHIPLPKNPLTSACLSAPIFAAA